MRMKARPVIGTMAVWNRLYGERMRKEELGRGERDLIPRIFMEAEHATRCCAWRVSAL